MYFCYDSEGTLHEGTTLTNAYRTAVKNGYVEIPEELIFIEGNKVKVDFEVVPATQIKAVTKKGTK